MLRRGVDEERVRDFVVTIVLLVLLKGLDSLLLINLYIVHWEIVHCRMYFELMCPYIHIIKVEVTTSVYSGV